ncbi:uncharacterized protein V1518DRAFT_419271 [Limtongia smithiae]|uniref:uncharacterized protein n=1 Tax=Limtongia smithiae TaxID=1125753 RepID=UPI0034CF597A
MPLVRVLIARHATRRDTDDPDWGSSSPTPYDPPLAPGGLTEADQLAGAVQDEIYAALDSVAPPFAPFRADVSGEADGDDGGDLCGCAFSTPTAVSVRTPTAIPPTAVPTTDFASVFSSSPSTLAFSLSTTSSSSSSAFFGSLSLLTPPLSATPHRRVAVCIHTSPFLRCVMTANRVARTLHTCKSNISVSLRVDAFLGEWLTPDYFANTSPPPDDGHASLVASAYSWLLSNGAAPYLDMAYPFTRAGRAGEYGERWRAMYERFSDGLASLVSLYGDSASPSVLDLSTNLDVVLVLVTHGAGCNALVGALSGAPILAEFGIASLSVAVPHKRHGPTSDSHMRKFLGASDYGYGGEQRDREGYGVLSPNIFPAVRETKPGIGDWDLTRIADTAHLLLGSDAVIDTPSRQQRFHTPLPERNVSSGFRFVHSNGSSAASVLTPPDDDDLTYTFV